MHTAALTPCSAPADPCSRQEELSWAVQRQSSTFVPIFPNQTGQPMKPKTVLAKLRHMVTVF